MQAPATPTNKGTILVVDDDPVVNDSLAKWFRSEGYVAQPVADSRQALEAVQEVEYDLALIDIQMPGMNGMELQSRLRGIRPEITVVIMTGYPSEDTEERAFALGACAYVTKPVDLDDLSNLVGVACSAGRRERQRKPGEP